MTTASHPFAASPAARNTLVSIEVMGGGQDDGDGDVMVWCGGECCV